MFEGFEDESKFSEFEVFVGKVVTIVKVLDKNVLTLVKVYNEEGHFLDDCVEVNTLLSKVEREKEVFLRIVNSDINH